MYSGNVARNSFASEVGGAYKVFSSYKVIAQQFGQSVSQNSEFSQVLCFNLSDYYFVFCK